MEGREKSSAAVRSCPRSSPTTLRPALVSSRARMAPVQPIPTMTASTSLSLVAMAASSGEVGDRLRPRGVALAAILVDLVRVGGGQAGEADQLPSGLVAVAAVHGIGEEALDRDLVQAPEERPGAEVR